MEETNNPQDELKYCYSQIADLTKENQELKEQLEVVQSECNKYKDVSQRKQVALEAIGVLVENF